MISLRKLTKRYGKHAVVEDLSLDIARGELVGFLGPNGAGKTTTLRMLTGYLRPDAGTVLVDGVDAEDEPEHAKGLIGYMPENAPLYGDMRAGEYLLFRARLRGIAKSARKSAVDRALEDAGVTDAARSRISTLSKGYRQRVALASAVLGRPPIVVLDEPTSGLDPNQIDGVRRLLADLKKTSAVIVSSHVLREIDATASRVVILHRGRIVADQAHEEGAPLEARFRELTKEPA